VSDILQRILATKRAEVAAARRSTPIDEIERRARAQPPARDFVAALRAKISSGSWAVIAEMKRASPSKGLLRKDFDPAAMREATKPGARRACRCLPTRNISRAAQSICPRRAALASSGSAQGFHHRAYQVLEARAIGADCIC
jgi:indole-3-glycerol phosphate synthase